MRVRLTDGTRQVDIRVPDPQPGDAPRGTPTLRQVEGAASRLLNSLAGPTADEDDTVPFGIRADLGGAALDSHTERAGTVDDYDTEGRES